MSQATLDSLELDQAKVAAFAEKMLGHLNGAALSLMTSIGHRTGLFDRMAALPPSTSHEIAAAAQLNERYVREWLGAMVTGGVVAYRPETKCYWLPPEHAVSLTRAAGPGNFGVTAQFVAVLGAVENEVVAAFEHGRGVPYSSYERFHEVMAEESAQTVIAALFEHILPLEEQLFDRLEQGIHVADIGCGAGRAMIAMAERFARSTFVGFDLCDETIAAATLEAERRGLKNVAFTKRDVSQLCESERFDLITAFDAIHDQGQPAQVLANIRAALKPGGIFLMQDIGGSSHVHHNIERPLSPFVYTISCMHCMSVSLAQGGVGLGAAWGRELAQAMLRDAGFRDFRLETLDHDILNEYYVVYK
jgi:2-polyprenyl-3-methyl-5-hydroxy-6-metoxy-1,4-benzoquinol methylase